MGFLSGVADLVDTAWAGVKTRPNLRQAYMKVANGADPQPKVFEAEKSYATIRVVELRLADARDYVTTYLPMCACFLRYGEGEAQRTLPIVIGAETIRGGLGAAAPGDAGQNLTIANIPLVSNLPVRSGGLMLYTSLCRFNDNSLSRALLGFATEAAKAVGGEALAAPVRVAADLTGKLQGLLGTQGVETRFARLDGDALTESGYRLLAASTGALSGALTVRDGQVMNGGLAIDDLDYLLLEFRHVPTLVDDDFAMVSALPFHQHFVAAMQSVVAKRGKPSETADDHMIKLETAIFASPALVWRDRFWLIQLYAAARRKLEASYKPVLANAGTLPELTALANRRRDEAPGSPVAPLLKGVMDTIGEALAAPRSGAVGVPADASDLGSAARALMTAQPLDDADEASIAAASFAYAGALRRR
ncbi:MAG: hypothetical protein H7Z10_12175 [Gemmatimonadaceae bacterium]|nr:hypothetical protein [Acetobacteraceae bacterium]